MMNVLPDFAYYRFAVFYLEKIRSRTDDAIVENHVDNVYKKANNKNLITIIIVILKKIIIVEAIVIFLIMHCLATKMS
jgi:hypothetical protein